VWKDAALLKFLGRGFIWKEAAMRWWYATGWLVVCGDSDGDEACCSFPTVAYQVAVCVFWV
jgi:hypothetical protein